MEFMHPDNDDVPFDSQEIESVQQTIIKNINSHLNEARYDGLLMLDKILPTCSKDALSKYGLFWIANATKVVENVHSSAQDLMLACKVLGSLIEHCKNIPELHKQISTRNIKQIINALNTLQTDAKCGAIYYLIAVLLYHFPEVCERFQELIKKMILLQIDSTDDNLVNASAKCYVLFSKATERSFKSPEATSIHTRLMYNEMLLCNSLHAIMDQLFCELIELKTVDIQDQLKLPSITDNNYNKQKQRFSNLCIYLSAMLRGYEARNSVLPQNILGVLHRGLTITPLNLKNKTSSNEQMLYKILSKLHISLLRVLDALINGFAQELVPYGKTILELFQKILQWTSTDLENQITFSNSKPFKNVKIQAYKCLCSWLMNTSSLSGIDTIANECVSFILKDIIPERDRILLTMYQKTQHFSKRAIERFKQSQYENSTVLNTVKDSTKSGHLDPDLCREALITLQNILFSGSILLKDTFYKNVLNTVIPLLYNLYLSSSEDKESFYKENNKCRLELFKVLRALQMNPHITLAFPIQYCLEISHMAAHDIDVNIVQEAKFAIAELEKIIHPAAPTLQLPRQQEPDNEFELIMNFSENQAEEIATTSKSDKRSRTEDEHSQNVDATSSVHKRPKIISSKCVKIIQNGDGIELVEVNDNILNLDKSQTGENSCEDKIDKSREDDNLCEEDEIGNIQQEQYEIHKIGNIQQEQYEIHCNKEKNQDNTKVINSTIENKVEYELIAHVNTTEEDSQNEENLISRTNETDKRIEEISLQKLAEEISSQKASPQKFAEEISPQKASPQKFAEEISPQKASLQKLASDIFTELVDPELVQEELNVNIRDSPNPFQEEVDWHS